MFQVVADASAGSDRAMMVLIDASKRFMMFLLCVLKVIACCRSMLDYLEYAKKYDDNLAPHFP
jgi:hypothetical protein